MCFSERGIIGLLEEMVAVIEIVLRHLILILTLSETAPVMESGYPPSKKMGDLFFFRL